MSDYKADMVEHLKEQQTLERLTLENILLARLDDCTRMRMLSSISGTSLYYWESVKTLVDVLRVVATPEYLQELEEIDKQVVDAQNHLNEHIRYHQKDLPEGERWSLNFTHFANLYFQACIRHIQRMGLGFSMISKEVWG
jgi:hypothetical protein